MLRKRRVKCDVPAFNTDRAQSLASMGRLQNIVKKLKATLLALDRHGCINPLVSHRLGARAIVQAAVADGRPIPPWS